MSSTSPTTFRFASSLVLLFGLAIAPAGLPLSKRDEAREGTVERIKVRGESLEGNLEGDSPQRDVSIYLPPSYKTDRKRRYPVVYLLHGFTDSDEQWFGMKRHFIDVPAVANKALAGDSAREMILVMPNAYTAYQGSMYSNSVTTGDWETFVTKDLVSYVDNHYRTIAVAQSRGLAGHSMGGYGTIRIGMKHSDVFSSLYILSPCCLAPNLNPQLDSMARAEAIRSVADLEKADFRTKAALASAAAWSPNPQSPPLYLDLPVKNGQLQPMVVAKWAANAPLAMIDQYIPNLKRLRAIAIDVGSQDEGIAASTKVLDQILKQYGVGHTFELYEGDHINRVAERVEKKVLPFFSSNLSTVQAPQ
jgi:S-formylglutathione hydrolase